MKTSIFDSYRDDNCRKLSQVSGVKPSQPTSKSIRCKIFVHNYGSDAYH